MIKEQLKQNKSSVQLNVMQVANDRIKYGERRYSLEYCFTWLVNNHLLLFKEAEEKKKVIAMTVHGDYYLYRW